MIGLTTKARSSKSHGVVLIERKLLFSEDSILSTRTLLGFEMKMLVVAAQHRSQCYGRNTSSNISTSSKVFKGINCRTFQSGSGILPPPPTFSPPFDAHQEPKSPRFYSEPPRKAKRSNPIAISPKPSSKANAFNDDFSYSELWAGPAYSNSPPPSSLPIPKFSLRQKRSISLELTLPDSEICLGPHLLSKSAPSSPTWEPRSPAVGFSFNTSFATENLRRILHLDITDD